MHIICINNLSNKSNNIKSNMKVESEKAKKWKTTKKPAPGHKLNIKSNKELFSKLQNTRVVQRELVYIIGLSPRIANKAVYCCFN